MLYQWELGRSDLDWVLRTFWHIDGRSDQNEDDPARRFAERLVRGTAAALEEIDPLIAACAQHWRLSRMAVVDRLILRLAAYELLHAPDTPPVVAINEAVELAKRYGTDESSAFVNGVLDEVRRRVSEP
jgi:N utilization substance protein B